MSASAALLVAIGASAAQNPPAPVEAPKEEPMSFTDPVDGAFDISRFLASQVGFLPVPFLITEPAVGFGGGLAVLFLSDTLGKVDAQGNPKEPPDVTVLAGGYTESESRFLGLGHFGSWDHDRVRYTGVAGYGLANLEFFGTGSDPAGASGERSLDFQLEGLMLRQELIARLPDTSLFLGLRYEYANTRTDFESGIPAVDNAALDNANGGLAAVAQFDTRDNIFSPNRGANVRVVASWYDEVFGGDTAYSRLDLELPFWIPIGERWVLNLSGLASFCGDGAPFYSLPYVTLRGVPALRYQGHDTFSFETELRWNFTGRWSLVGFGGIGQAVDSTSDFGEADTIVAGGLGIRYLIARAFGLQVGFDIAQGPEETVFYIVAGR